MRRGRFGTVNLKPSGAYISDRALRRLVTAVSTTWAMASMPVQAVTRAGWESVNLGSRIATRAAAFGSPHAIFWCVFSSAMRAEDWHSLPVPAAGGNADH